MLSALETTILKGLIHNEDYTRKVLPYVKDEYFETSVGRSIFSLCTGYFVEYGECPSKQSLAVQFEQLEGVSEDEFRQIGQALDLLCDQTEVGNTDFLVDSTENWCKERAVYLALLESISIHEGNDINKTRDSIPQLLTEALAVCFDAHVGHDYLNDYLNRYDFYHVKENRISFGLEYFDKITDGGLVNKTLNIALAGTGVGKSLFMCSLASTVLLQGKNVLYITAEMAEERIAERIDANLLNTPIQSVKDIPKQLFEDKVQALQKKTQGRLFIKEYPTASAHAGHFDALLKELSIKQSFVPDVVFVDYLNICISSRYRPGSNVNSYTVVKSIAEELRGLAAKHNVPIVSATQTTRGGFNSSDVELTDTSESFGLPATADLMFALISNDELESMNQIMVKQLKNRYNDHNTHKKFVVGIDRAKMRLYDAEPSAQVDILETKPTMRYDDDESKFNSKSFAGFTY
jgi:archaellum biogenesis ATPase FlaH